MQEKELKFTHKRRTIDAPFCPCGEENNKKNPQFCPFEDTEGKYGYCHRCDRRFMPGDTKEVQYVYVAPVKVPQKFINEPAWNWEFPDTMIDPEPEGDKLRLAGDYTVTYYFRNIHGKLCSAKKIVYTFPTFKRDKNRNPIFPFTRDSGYYPCLYYERDLYEYPSATVILVESEKTALLLRYVFKTYLEEFIYLATGGSNGLTDEKIQPLKDRDILICFDCDNGELQEDGTIKSPKGREAAQNTYVKLSVIARPIVIDIDPSRTDGLDLGDIYKTIDIDYFRTLSTKDATKINIPDALIEELRAANRDGAFLTPEKLSELGNSYSINPEKILSMYRVIRANYKSETGLNKAPLVPRIEHWLSTHYEFKRNSITTLVKSKKKGEAFWADCNSSDIWRDVHHDIRSIGRGSRGKDISISKHDIDTILESSYVKDYNPYVDYFNSLPAWDNNDHITHLASHITTDNQVFWYSQFKKCLVRMIACTLENIPNRIVMTLVQEAQESGKSFFIRFLCPPALQDYYKESPMEHDKDTEIALTENFIWNLEELADLNRKQVADMKAVISRESIKQRRTYARYERLMKRTVNFWGSTNKTEFLVDTQNTRWLCFTIKDVNHDYNNTQTGVKNVDINKVWAQAYHLYKTGFCYQMSKEDREQRDFSNQNFETMPEEKQLIMRYFVPGTPGAATSKFMANYDIKEHLNQNTSAKTRLNEMNIGRSMKQLGFKGETRKIQGKTARGYWVRVLTSALDYDPEVAQPELFQITKEVPIDLPF